MKVIFFTENSYCGGLDSFLIALIINWPHHDDEIKVICNAGHPGHLVLTKNLSHRCTIETHQLLTYPELANKLNQFRILKHLRKILSPILRYGYFLYYLYGIRTILLQEKADRLVVVNGGHPGGDTCRAAIISWRLFVSHKPRALYNFHNLAALPRWFEKYPEKLLDTLIIRWSIKLIAVSQACAESMLVRIGNNYNDAVSYIHNGISAPPSLITSSVPLRQELNIPHGGFLCLMLATYEPRKGHDFLLRVFQQVVKEVPNAYLVICGYGYPQEIKHVEELMDKYGLSQQVRLQGFRNDVNVMLKQSDLLLVASQTNESFGLTSVEAMANRIPVLATRVGGIPEVVMDGDGGFCVEFDDVQGYADKIVLLLKNPEIRIEQAEKGYQRYRRLFSAEKMAKTYAEIIRHA